MNKSRIANRVDEKTRVFLFKWFAVPLKSKYTGGQDGIRALNGVCLIWKMTHPRSEKTEQNSRIGQSDTEGMPEIWAGIAESSTDFVRGNEKSLCHETQARKKWWQGPGSDR